MRKLYFACIVTLFSAQLFAQKLSNELDSLINHFVDSKKLHGCVMYVQRGNEVVHFKSYGFSSIEENRKMDKDVIFRIASMSKPIVAAGALKLYEEGKFLLDEPVKKYIPQFKELRVCLNIGTDSTKLVDLEREITIRDLFRHTAGFGYAYEVNQANDTIDNLYLAHDLSANNQTSDDFLNKISKIPLKYQPGSQWQYSYSIDILGFLIERISQQNLQDYLTRTLFVPLSMKSTGFYVSKENTNRLSANYLYRNDSLLLIDNPTTSEYLVNPKIYSGGGGLKDNVGGIVTSTKDFANFCSMILHYGKFNGKQILKRQTIELMISNQIGDFIEKQNGSGYGLGIGVSSGQNNGKTKSVHWAGGPYNTVFDIDFEKQLIGILMTQNSPWSHLDLTSKFISIVKENVP